MPRIQHDVSYGPVYADVVSDLDNPLGGEPSHSTTPQFDRTDSEVYGPFVTDDCSVVVDFVPWPTDLSDELTEIVSRLVQPGELTQEIPVIPADDQATLVAAIAGQLPELDDAVVDETVLTETDGEQS